MAMARLQEIDGNSGIVGQEVYRVRHVRGDAADSGR
jgi:hypothetical protein